MLRCLCKSPLIIFTEKLNWQPRRRSIKIFFTRGGYPEKQEIAFITLKKLLRFKGPTKNETDTRSKTFGTRARDEQFTMRNNRLLIRL